MYLLIRRLIIIVIIYLYYDTQYIFRRIYNVIDNPFLIIDNKIINIILISCNKNKLSCNNLGI